MHLSAVRRLLVTGLCVLAVPAHATPLVRALGEANDPVAVCGDGIVTPPEECDDGNLVDGDCCDSTCHFEAAGTICANPGDPCLESYCDGAGTCDLDGDGCHMPAPRAGFLSIQLGRQDRLTWSWRVGVSTKDDFADPTLDTDYDFCLLDKGTGQVRLLAHAEMPAGGTCGKHPCWRDTPNGYSYRNVVAPVQQVFLHGGLPGTAWITATSFGTGLSLPPMPLAPPVLVRLRTPDGSCWGSNYTLPGRNSRRVFFGRGDP